MKTVLKNKSNDWYFKYLVGLSALIILLVSAYFSIRGISQLFSGQRTVAMILAGSLEFAKVTTTTYLTRYWSTTNKVIRTYFIIATVILVTISSAGIFANLTDAYSVTALKTEASDIISNSLLQKQLSLEEQKKDFEYEINSTNAEINLIRTSIQKNDTQVQDLYSQMAADSTVNWISSIWEYKNQNKEYKEEISQLRKAKEISREKINAINDSLQVVYANLSKDKLSNKSADVGPLKKLSDLFNLNMDTIVKYFIFTIIIVFDPLGILLMVTFNLMLIWNSPENLNNSSINSQSVNNNQNQKTPLIKNKVESVKFLESKEEPKKKKKRSANGSQHRIYRAPPRLVK